MQAYINHQIVRWAVERSGHSHDSIAKKLNAKTKQVTAWESGDALPTFNQAQHLARVLSIPFGYLYLNDPPAETLPLPDLRTVGGLALAKPSPEFLSILYSISVKQRWYKEYLVAQGQKPKQFVASFKIDSNATDVANNIRTLLNVDDGLRHKCASWEAFLTALIRSAEALGVLTMRSGIVASNTRRILSVDEFRGFAISDEVAPLIFINGRDSKAAQIFTIIHELAHIWIGENGISNVSLESQVSATNAVELFCNNVAAEVLLPSADFLSRWNAKSSVADNVSGLRQYYRVSSLVVLRRALDLSKLSFDQFIRHYRSEQEAFKKREAKRGEGGNFYLSLRAKNSLLVEPVARGVISGSIPYTEAGALLDVSPAKVADVALNLAGGT